MRPSVEAALRHHRRARGFTLLEVLVAMALLGAGAALVYASVGAATRLAGRMDVHEAATALARAKLDEVLAHPEFALADDERSDDYAGHTFGFRLSTRPASWIAPRQLERIRDRVNFDLEEVLVEVFWGEGDRRQSYELRTLRYRLRANPGPGVAPAGASRAASAPNTLRGAEAGLGTVR